MRLLASILNSSVPICRNTKVSILHTKVGKMQIKWCTPQNNTDFMKTLLHIAYPKLLRRAYNYTIFVIVPWYLDTYSKYFQMLTDLVPASSNSPLVFYHRTLTTMFVPFALTLPLFWNEFSRPFQEQLECLCRRLLSKCFSDGLILTLGKESL